MIHKVFLPAKYALAPLSAARSIRTFCGSALRSADDWAAAMISIVQNRRCRYCGRTIHCALGLDANGCGRLRKSSCHQDKPPPPLTSQAGAPGPGPGAPGTFSPIMTAVAKVGQMAAPKGAEDRILRQPGGPRESGTLDFAVPLGRTKHADGTLASARSLRCRFLSPPSGIAESRSVFLI